MNTRRTVGALMIACLALVAGACSSDDKDESSDSKKTTTTTEADESSDTSDPDATTTTLSDEDYAAEIEAINAELAAAGTDFCAITNITQQPSEPSTPTQVEALVNVYSTLFNTYAAALPPESAATADSLRTIASTLVTDAAAAGFAPDYLSGDEIPAALDGEAYTAAMNEIQTYYTATCVTAEPSTTVPAG